MATAMDKSTLGKGSDFFDDNTPLCEPCSVEDKQLPADRFCSECQEYMCQKCSKSHMSMKKMRDHQLLALEDIKKAPAKVQNDKCSHKCEEHDKRIKYYCQAHASFGCSVCFTMEHKQCSTPLYLPKATTDITNQPDFQQYDNNLKSLETAYKAGKDDVEKMLKQVEADDSQIKTVFNDFRTRLNNALDDLESDVTTEAKKIKDEESDKLKSLSKELAASLGDVDALVKTTETLLQSGRYCDVFVAVKQEENQLVRLNNELEAMKTGKTCTRYVFQPNTDVLQPVILGSLETHKVELFFKVPGPIIVRPDTQKVKIDQNKKELTEKLVFSDEEDDNGEPKRRSRKRGPHPGMDPHQLHLHQQHMQQQQQQHQQQQLQQHQQQQQAAQGDAHPQMEREFAGEKPDKEEAGNKEGGRKASDLEQNDLDADSREEEFKQSDGQPPMPRQAWEQPMPPPFRGGPRPPHPGMDARGGWQMGQMNPLDFMGPRGPYPPQFRMGMPPQGPPGQDGDDEEEVLVESKSETRSNRTSESESSEKGGERPQSRDGQKYPPGSQAGQYGKSYSRGGLPPGFQKQHSGEDSPASRVVPPHSQQSPQPTPSSPQPLPGPGQMRPGQGPPSPWGPYPWGAMPPHPFMGFGPRPPMDMQGMPIFPAAGPYIRRRTDSHGSGTESQDEKTSRHKLEQL